MNPKLQRLFDRVESLVIKIQILAVVGSGFYLMMWLVFGSPSMSELPIFELTLFRYGAILIEALSFSYNPKIAVTALVIGIIAGAYLEMKISIAPELFRSSYISSEFYVFLFFYIVPFYFVAFVFPILLVFVAIRRW